MQGVLDVEQQTFHFKLCLRSQVTCLFSLVLYVRYLRRFSWSWYFISQDKGPV